MESLLALAQGFFVAFEPTNLLFAAIRVVLGTAVGVLPGIAASLIAASPEPAR